MTAFLLLMSYMIHAQTNCEDVDRELNLKVISKEFKNLPSDSALSKLEEKYFPLNSLAVCLFLLEANMTDSHETRLIYRRVADIALRYIGIDTLILLTDYNNSGKVTEIFNLYSHQYQVRYISMGERCYQEKVGEAIQYFNQQMECHLIDRNGKDWRKDFHAQLETYYNDQLKSMSRKERKKIKKNNY